jgi:hypothetical protein
MILHGLLEGASSGSSCQQQEMTLLRARAAAAMDGLAAAWFQVNIHAPAFGLLELQAEFVKKKCSSSVRQATKDEVEPDSLLACSGCDWRDVAPMTTRSKHAKHLVLTENLGADH